MTGLVTLREAEDGGAHVVCLPHAGAGVGAYGAWRSLVPATVSLHAAELGGRERRIHDPPPTDLVATARALAAAAGALAGDAPLVLFGHSMGALLAYEMARHLDGDVHLVVSGCTPPHLPRRHRAAWRLPDAELIRELTELGGIPKEIAEEEELLRLILPTLRADMQMVHRYAVGDPAPLDCPLTCLASADDRSAPPAEVAEWRRHTTGDVALHLFGGGHFFVRSEVRAVVELVTALAVRALLARSR